MPATDDARLYEVYQAVFAASDGDLGVRSAGEKHQAVRQAVFVQVEERSRPRLAACLAAGAAPDVGALGDAALFLLLYAAPREVDDAAGPSTPAARRERRERLDRVAREAVRRGGRLRDVALATYPFADVGWADEKLLRDLLGRLRGMNGRRAATGRTRERVLCEVVRRSRDGEQNRAAWADVLAEELRRMRRAAAAAEDFAAADVTHTLETLTALRRVQGKGDPVRVEVAGPAEVRSVFPALPRLDVSLVNCDVGGEAVPFTRGGDYRSGRQARWRVEARDEAGTPLPVRGPGFGMGGGLFSIGRLGPGEKWGTSLAVESFVPALPPGRYTLRVLYHDSVCLADEPAVDGLIVCASGPLTLTVAPLVFAEDEVDAGKVGDLLGAFDDKRRLKVVAGTYGAWAHDLVPPGSPQGKLLALGLPAVPPLLDALDDPELTPSRRAVVLSLLFSLTGQNDPRDAAGVLGGYDSADGPWSVVGDGAAGIGWGERHVPGGAKVDDAAQRVFARRWTPWKQYVRVTPRRAAADAAPPT